MQQPPGSHGLGARNDRNAHTGRSRIAAPARHALRPYPTAGAEHPRCPHRGPDAGVGGPAPGCLAGEAGLGFSPRAAGETDKQALAPDSDRVVDQPRRVRGTSLRRSEGFGEACAKRWPSQAVRASAGTVGLRGGRGTSRPRRGGACVERTGKAVSARSARAPGMRRVAQPARRAEARSSPAPGLGTSRGGRNPCNSSRH